MNAWIPVLVGFGVIAVVIVASRVLPRSWLHTELGKWYGAKPSGAFFVMSRRDLGRRAIYSAIAAALLAVSSFALVVLVERAPNGSRAQLIAQTYLLIAVVLAGVAALAAILSAINIVFWRPRRLEMTPIRWLNLAH